MVLRAALTCSSFHVDAAGAVKTLMWHSSAQKLFTCVAGRPTVVLTREHGKNDKMMQELSKRDIPCIELPLIEHASGPDRCCVPAK
jgi:hypothetical protein